ncbi:MAG: helix-turn-helix domain-containing protein, partial [Mycobacterium sp.]|nr:helix-turn-helix domain-containing protein [Mycobacterium sp.]
MSTKSWDQDLVTRIAARIKDLRKDQGLSVQKLADLTEVAHHAIPRTTIADIELGRRKYVSVAELLVLAEVLNTPPITLLFPPPYLSLIHI